MTSKNFISKYKYLENTIRKSKKGDEYLVKKVDSSAHIEIVFLDESKYSYITNIKCVMENKVKNKYGKHVYDVGYIGDTTTKIKGEKRQKQSYEIWVKMIQRCYDTSFKKKHPTYENCFVWDDWHCYANFEQWFKENYYEIDGEPTFLDKDILSIGNKIYSPTTCCFVPRIINNVFTLRQSQRGNFPLGVHWDKKSKKFRASMNKYGKRTCLGWFNDKTEAFAVYKTEKEKYIKKLADEYKKYLPQNVYEALYNYEVEITD